MFEIELLLYMKKLFSNGNNIVYITAIFGGLIVITGALVGSNLNNKNSKKDLENEMNSLKTTIREQSETLARKDAELQAQANEILQFSNEINSNTLSIQDLASKISDVVDETSVIANLIKEEQREKGSFSLKLPIASNYLFHLGGNAFSVSRAQLEATWIPSTPYGLLPIGFKAKGDELLVSGTLHDRDRKIIASMYESRWAINKGLCFSVNHDEHGLEIIDQNGVVVLVVLLEDTKLIIEYVTHGTEAMVIVNNKGIATFPIGGDDYEDQVEKLREEVSFIFEHRGEGYLGTRLNRD